jgi:hypothetical protein
MQRNSLRIFIAFWLVLVNVTNYDIKISHSYRIIDDFLSFEANFFSILLL